jgi:hypothetical protein
MRHGMSSVVLVLLATGCEITVDKGFSSGDSGDTDSTPITDTEETVTPTAETGDSITDPDGDGDGFPASVDCVDTDPAINPDADEHCDGFDNNCNAITDDEFAATLDGAMSYATIDEALAGAVDGSRVDVCPGTHVMTPHTVTAGLTVRGVSGMGATTISGDATGAVFTVDEGGALVLRGVHLQGVPDRTSSARLVTLMGDDPILELLESSLTDNAYGALEVAETEDAQVTITDSDISQNGLPADPGAALPAMPEMGGGIFSVGGVTFSITNSTISANNAIDGGGIYASNPFGAQPMNLDAVTIDGNVAEDEGGGLFSIHVLVVGTNGTIVSGNSAVTGGGLVAMYAELQGLLVSTNTASLLGGGAQVAFDSFYSLLPDSTLTGIVFDQNTAPEAAAIWADESVTIDSSSAVTLNTATTGGAVGCVADGDVEIESLGADFGSSASANDNTPTDVYVASTAFVYDGAATFTCVCDTGCVTP